VKPTLLQTSVEKGAGDRTVCESWFKPPGVHIGPAISIPETATPFGVVAVTDGKASAMAHEVWALAA
jgi:hypothetical protein